MSQHWKIFYEKFSVQDPSPFAKFCVENGYTQNKSILEIGSGNGRDAYFFGKNSSKHVIGLDLNTLPESTPDITFIQESIGNIHSLDLGCVDFVYSRFSLHSIDRQTQDTFVKWCRDSLKKGGIVAIETRSVNDPLCGIGEKVGDDEYNGETQHSKPHYRRFIRLNDLKDIFENQNFKILSIEESDTFAPFGERKPICIRMFAEKL